MSEMFGFGRYGLAGGGNKDSNHRSRFPERQTWDVDNEHYYLSDVYRDRFNYPGLERPAGCNFLRKLRARTIIRAMTITEWILVLTAAAFLLAPVAALSLRPIEDREALLRDVIATIPPGHASSKLVCREGCSIR